MKRIKQIVKRLTFGIRTKLLFSLFAVLILSISALTLFEVSIYRNKLQSNSTQYANTVVSSLTNNLSNYINEVYSLTDLIVYNNYIQGFALNQYNSGANELTTTNASSRIDFQMSLELFTNIINSRKDVESINIVGKDELLLSKSVSPAFIAQDLSAKPWYSQVFSRNSKPMISFLHKAINTAKSEPLFAISRNFQSYDGLNNIGVILIELNMSTIKDLCSSIQLNNDGCFALFSASDAPLIFYPSNPKARQTLEANSTKLNQQLLPIFKKYASGSVNVPADSERYNVAFQTIQGTDITVVTITPYSSILADASSIGFTVLFIGLIFLVFILITTALISSAITKPITVLKNNMDRAHLSDFSVHSQIHSNDEVGALSNSFNEMLDRLEQLMTQNVDEQQKKRIMELKSLQHQINPHFLYNTLDSIIWMIEAGDENVVSMIEALSKLFRLSLNNGKEMISLREELEHVRNYLYIQHMRYKGKFEYGICAGEEILNTEMPHLILQPLVENAIYHGIKNKIGPCSIQINASAVNHNLVISIEDTGIGMDADMCSSMLNQQSVLQKKGSGIGVRNVNERIKLAFGDEYGLSYQSEPDVGTTVFVNLPLKILK